MATINSRGIVDAIIEGNGYYMDDRRVVKIVQYNNAFDGRLAYGLIYAGDSLDAYQASPFIRNPKTLFEVKDDD